MDHGSLRILCTQGSLRILVWLTPAVLPSDVEVEIALASYLEPKDLVRGPEEVLVRDIFRDPEKVLVRDPEGDLDPRS